MSRSTHPSRVTTLLRALAALVALGAILVGVPVLLAGLTAALPIDLGALHPGSWQHADDGRLLLLAIVALAWVAWAVAAGSVAIEVWAAARRVPAPRLPGLAWPQRAAAGLVAAVTVALSPGVAAAALAPAGPGAPGVAVAQEAGVPRGAPQALRTAVHAGAQAAPAADDTSTGPGAAGPASAVPAGAQAGTPAGSEDLPTITTQRHDTLWMLAEQHLGSGPRYTEIVELNRGVTQPDGRTLADNGRLYPGWTLRLPQDARTDVPRPDRHRVQRGDTLWQIADDELGDPLRYPEIASANRGDLQPDGRRLSDPDLIVPGWVLEIPGDPQVEAAEEAAADPDAGARAGDDGDAGAADDGAQRPGRDAGGIQRPSGSEPTDHPGPSSLPDTGAGALPDVDRSPRPSAGADGAGATSPAPEGDGEVSSNTPGVQAPAIDRAGTPTAARSTQPSRGSAARLPTPRPVAAHAATEPARAAGMPRDSDCPGSVTRSEVTIPLPAGGALAGLLLAGVGLELSRRRRQFQRYRRPGERMPPPSQRAADLEQVARTATAEPGLDLVDRALTHLAAGAGDAALPSARLVRLGPARVTLQLEAPARAAIAPFQALDPHRWVADAATVPTGQPEVERPYPGLLVLGGSGDETVLLDLHAVGTLVVEGDPEHVPDVLRAMAAELAFGPISAATERMLCLVDPAIAAAVESGGLAVETDPRRAAAALARRLDQPWEGDDPLQIVLADRPLDVAVPPGRGCALITVGPSQGAGARLVVADGAATLLPDGVDLVPQRMSQESTAAAADALQTTDLPAAASADDRPPPVSPVPAADPLPADGAHPPEQSPTVPRILLLGDVEVRNAQGKAESARIGRLAETAAFVLLNPAARPSQLQAALWPGRRANPQTCRQMISRTRTWLGRTDEGEPFLMAFATTEGRLRLRPEVGSDWADFQRLAAAGLADPAGTEQLAAALRLVRGRPFGSVASRELPWADLHLNEMIGLITDVAHELAVRHERAGRPVAAREAALRGLLTGSESEVLRAVLARTPG